MEPCASTPERRPARLKHPSDGSSLKADKPFPRSPAMSRVLTLHVNGKAARVRVDDPRMPLLYVLRDDLDLHGPRFGCGLGQCGACTVLIDGAATRSCITPAACPIPRCRPSRTPRRAGRRSPARRWLLPVGKGVKAQRNAPARRLEG